MTIGLIAALHPETKTLKNHFKFKKLNDSLFYWKKGEVLLFETGVGQKRVLESLPGFLNNFSLDAVLNIGSAGALDSSLALYDVLLPREVIIAFPPSLLSHKGMKGNFHIVCDNIWRENIKNKLNKACIPFSEPVLFTASRVSSGKRGKVCGACSKSERKIISHKYRAQAIDMEAGFVLPITQKKEIPCVVLKIISDTPEFPEFSKHIRRTAEKIKEVMKHLLP